MKEEVRALLSRISCPPVETRSSAYPLWCRENSWRDIKFSTYLTEMDGEKTLLVLVEAIDKPDSLRWKRKRRGSQLHRRRRESVCLPAEELEKEFDNLPQQFVEWWEKRCWFSPVVLIFLAPPVYSA